MERLRQPRMAAFQLQNREHAIREPPRKHLPNCLGVEHEQKTAPKPPRIKRSNPKIPTEMRTRDVPGSAAMAPAQRGPPAEATARATTRRPWRGAAAARGVVQFSRWLVTGKVATADEGGEGRGG